MSKAVNSKPAGKPRRSAEPANLSADVRARLNGAVFGTDARQLVSVRASDLRACLAVAEAVHDAQALVGDNELLRRALASKTEEAARVPMLADEVSALRATVAALRNRGALAIRLLRGG